MKIRWTAEAYQDRLDIWTYLAARNETAALRVDELISESVSQPSDFPMLGHEGEVPGTRELTPHPRYRLVYEIFGETVWILTIIHTSREWPQLRA